VAGLDYSSIPSSVRERAKHLILDAVGIALASTRHDFAHRSLAALTEMSGGAGDSDVIGFPVKLQIRDAIVLNGILVHGLDYDDTHARGVLHATASCFPSALGVAARVGAGGRELLAAYVAGVEVAARLGAVARGGFHQVGFHPTGLVGTFACALIAGRLLGLDVGQLDTAQGIALSVTAGSLEFLQDGAWTKRMHPGWAGASGLAAATLARHGFVGPRQPYEGRFGLFASYLGEYARECELELATAGLGAVWEVGQVSVKPIPACHFTHACADAAAILHARHGIAADRVQSVLTLVPREVVKTVCEPMATKQRPQNRYDAQFSIPYIVATALARGSFGLQHLDDQALADAEVLALARKVRHAVDPNSPFPRYYSGEVIVTTDDGREYRHREEVNRGSADRPLSNEEIVCKFIENASFAVSPARCAQIRDLVLGLDSGVGAAAFARSLAAPSS
jgi:2-methylcitrate dehydratase PrpD